MMRMILDRWSSSSIERIAKEAKEKTYKNLVVGHCAVKTAFLLHRHTHKGNIINEVHVFVSLHRHGSNRF